VRPDDLDAVKIAAGFTSQQVGSHKTYRCDGAMLTVPQHKPFLKSVYVLIALDRLATLEAGETEGGGEMDSDEEEEENG
jgi:hypothetical protein